MTPRRLFRTLRAFHRDEQGAVALLFGVMAVMLVMIVGVATDVGNAYRIRSALQESLDAAMLATAANPSEDIDEVRRQVRRFFEENLAGAVGEGTASITELRVRHITKTNIMHADLTATSQTFFGGILQRETLTYSLTSTVQRAPPTEVALVLSEGGLSQLPYDPFVNRTVLEVQKQVASDIVKYVLRFPDNRVSVVPYSSLVNIDVSGGRQMPGWVDVKNTPKPPPVPNPPPNWGGCVGFRPHAAGQYADGKYMTTIGRLNVRYPTYQMVPDVPFTSYVEAGLSYRPTCRTPVIPLYDRSRQQSILKRIESMWAPTNNSNIFQGHDNVALGLIWGWNMLNPAEPFGARKPGEIENINGQKVLILFAFFDTSMWYLSYPDGQPRQVQSDAEKARAVSLVQELCQNIKDDGITIYVVIDRNSVKYGPDGPNWGTTTFPIDQCASSEKHLVNFTGLDRANPFDPGDRLTPMYAMREVGRQLTEPRLIPCPSSDFCDP